MSASETVDPHRVDKMCCCPVFMAGKGAERWRGNQKRSRCTTIFTPMGVRVSQIATEFLNKKNKVITTTMITPLDDPTWCAQSVVADLQHLGVGYVRVGDGLSR